MRITRSNLQKIINEELNNEMLSVKDLAVGTLAFAIAGATAVGGIEGYKRVKELETFMKSEKMKNLSQDQMEELYDKMFGQGKAKQDGMLKQANALELFTAGQIKDGKVEIRGNQLIIKK